MSDSIDVRRAVLCARHGHPPVVDLCIGQVTCSRCGAILGDTLMGSYSLKERIVVGHDCDVCRRIWDAMTPTQKKLTPNPFAKTKVPA